MLVEILLSILVLVLLMALVVLIKKVQFLHYREKNQQRYMEDVFHELKTHLAAIKVLADSLLSQENAGVDIYREFMGDIRAEADKENTIICDFLSMVKLENTKWHMDITEFSVNELTRNIIEPFVCIAEKKEISICFEAQQDITICSNQRRVTEILTNLIENAVKYNVEHGFIKIVLSLEQDMCCIKISDSGIGISEQEQKKVFERFYRVKTQMSEMAGGTGLGLSIVHSSVAALCGSIELKSIEGKGSTFTVKIPVKLANRKGKRKF